MLLEYFLFSVIYNFVVGKKYSSFNKQKYVSLSCFPKTLPLTRWKYSNPHPHEYYLVHILNIKYFCQYGAESRPSDSIFWSNPKHGMFPCIQYKPTYPSFGLPVFWTVCEFFLKGTYIKNLKFILELSFGWGSVKIHTTRVSILIW